MFPYQAKRYKTMDLKKKHISDRDKVLKRVFELYKTKGLYTQERFHDFCRAVKGKSEQQMLHTVNGA